MTEFLTIRPAIKQEGLDSYYPIRYRAAYSGIAYSVKFNLLDRKSEHTWGLVSSVNAKFSFDITLFF